MGSLSLVLQSAVKSESGWDAFKVCVRHELKNKNL